MAEQTGVDFEQFRESWLNSVQEDQPSTRELGRRFALKLVTQWVDASEQESDLVLCDGAGDGGIDIALLDTGPASSNDDPEESGHTWYLVQSKYGSAFAGVGTLLAEGQKVIDTLDGKRAKLSSLAEGTLERLTNFRNGAGPSDQIILVFATERPLTEVEQRALQDLRAMGRARIGPLFDVETISIATIYARLQEEVAAEAANRLTIEVDARLVPSGDDLLVGSIGLVELYEFLRRYREKTGDLDQIYEKNVRRFLGGRGKVNKTMQATLRDAPERFGLYNNGITLVVSGYTQVGSKLVLVEPYIVNGCQTSRTIWEVFHQRLGAGGTGVNPEIEEWKLRIAHGVVVTKIVKVGNAGEKLLQAITRYTNSQNAVREKDFLALTGDFRTWQKELSDDHGIYLEIQRGGWDSQKALQNHSTSTKIYTKSANAADLIKVYGAGWLSEAGLAFGKNPPFLPDGAVFKRIVNSEAEQSRPFGAIDLIAAYLLQQGASSYGFGRGAEKQSRRQSRFLFYLVAIDLLKDALSRGSYATDPRTLSDALVAILQDNSAKSALLDPAIEVIDSYFTQGTEDTVFDEPAFLNAFNADLNAFLKWEKLGKAEDSTPRLRSALAITKQVMGRTVGGHPSQRSILISVVKQALGMGH
jgi:AIPR protein